MARFALSAVATFALFASLTGSADAGVRFVKVTPRGVAVKSFCHTPAGKPKVTTRVVGPMGGSVQRTTVYGPYHTWNKTTVTRPNGFSYTVRTRD